jgi:hypothetical protein
MNFNARSAVDNHPALIAIEIAISLLDDHGFIAARFTLADDRALVNAIAIIVVTARSDRYACADRADTNANANFFRACRHGTVNSHRRDRGHCKTLDHRMLLNVDELSVRQCGVRRIVPEKRIAIFRQFASSFGTQVFIVNQTAISTMMKTMPPQTTGVTFLELPLRGESFGAWL